MNETSPADSKVDGALVHGRTATAVDAPSPAEPNTIVLPADFEISTSVSSSLSRMAPGLSASSLAAFARARAAATSSQRLDERRLSRLLRLERLEHQLADRRRHRQILDRDPLQRHAVRGRPCGGDSPDLLAEALFLVERLVEREAGDQLAEGELEIDVEPLQPAVRLAEGKPSVDDAVDARHRDADRDAIFRQDFLASEIRSRRTHIDEVRPVARPKIRVPPRGSSRAWRPGPSERRNLPSR